MRYITNRGNPPDELLSLDVKRSLAEMLNDKSGKPHKKVVADLYKGGENKTVVKALLRLYNYKCSYCERYIHTAKEVEHYRPISKYFWLSYEWTNLLISCHECNKASGGKGFQFPIGAKRKISPPDNEKDYKINFRIVMLYN